MNAGQFAFVSKRRARMTLLGVTAVLLAGAAPRVAQADTLFTDTFTSSTSPWAGYTGTLSLSNANLNGTGGNAMLMSASGGFPLESRAFTLTSLNVGDSIELSFDMKFTGTVPNTSDDFRFGLGNSSVSKTYGFEVGTGTGTTAAALYFPVNAVSGPSSTNLGVSPSTGNALQNGTYHIDMTITRTAGGMSLSATANGTPYSATDSASNLTSFNAAYIGEGGTQSNFVVDNVSVSTTPEPASVSVLALGLGGCLRRRRRSA